MKSILVLSAIAALGLIASVPATEHCARNRAVYQQTYVAPQVQYVQKQAAYVQKQEVVYKPYAVEVVKNPDYYYSVDGYYRDKLLVDALAGRIQQMQATGQLLAPPAPQQNTIGGGKAVGEAAVTPVAGEQDAKVLAVVKNHCARCHHPGKAGGDLVLVTEDGRLASVSPGKAWQCYGLAMSGEMPKGQKPVPDEDTKILYDWAKAVSAQAKK